MERMAAASVPTLPRYRFKPRPNSSHLLVLDQFAAKGEGRRVLDIGCAGGYLSEILAARGFAVTGVDMAGTPFPESIRFVPADLDHGLPPLDGPFDFIICADVLEHLRDPLRMLEQCRERLAPGGALIASLPNSGNAYFRWNVLLGRFPQHEQGLFDRTHLRFYTWSGWRDLLQQGGFHIETVQVSGVPAGLAVPAWDGSPPVRAVEWMSYQMARIWKTLFAYQFVVRARREREP
jgi:SAM-dependent methyltransferase